MIDICSVRIDSVGSLSLMNNFENSLFYDNIVGKLYFVF